MARLSHLERHALCGACRRPKPQRQRQRAAVALAAAVATLLAGCDPGGDADDEAVRMQVRTVIFDREHVTPVVILEELDGTRRLPIWIGVDEARSIARELEERAAPRPNGHDLAKQLLGHLDAELDRVIVTELHGGTFYALMRVETDEKWIELDARPSDAIAIALRTGAPIFVAERVLRESLGVRAISDDGVEL